MVTAAVQIACKLFVDSQIHRFTKIR